MKHRLTRNKIFVAAVFIVFSFLQTNRLYAQAVIQNALPQNPTTEAGSVTVTTTGNDMHISASNASITNWGMYNIGQLNNVYYALNGTHLDRVTGGSPSFIWGGLHVQGGQLFLVNPNSLYFGAGSRVDAPGLVASTLNINSSDFLAGNYKFTQNGNEASITNNGMITTNGGFIALLSNAVVNNGIIVANLGKVVLASGEKITVGLDSFNDIQVDVDELVKNNVYDLSGNRLTDGIKNTGAIIADGGKILLTSKSLNNIFDYAINSTGVLQANNLVNHEGFMELLTDGGNTLLSGSVIGNLNLIGSGTTTVSTLDVSGPITINGGTLAIYDGELFINGGTIINGGLLTLNGQNPFSGGTTLGEGTITITGGPIITTPPPTITITGEFPIAPPDGGTITITGGPITTTQPPNGGTITITGTPLPINQPPTHGPITQPPTPPAPVVSSPFQLSLQGNGSSGVIGVGIINNPSQPISVSPSNAGSTFVGGSTFTSAGSATTTTATTTTASPSTAQENKTKAASIMATINKSSGNQGLNQ